MWSHQNRQLHFVCYVEKIHWLPYVMVEPEGCYLVHVKDLGGLLSIRVIVGLVEH